MIKNLLILTVLFVGGCASSPYTYYVQPTPIQKDVSKYYMGNVNVNLKLGHGALDGDITFASEEQLTERFSSDLTKHLKEKNLLSSSGMPVTVNITYLRKFNVGGKSLNKPEISHSVVVSEGANKLASFGRSNYTTKYSYVKDIAVGAEIAAFKWGADDELQDIDLISQLIVDDLAKLGK